MLKNILESNFIKSVIILVGGSFGAQLILVVSSPILTRLFNPEDFGVLSVFSSILTILTVFSCLRYEVGLPLPREKKKAVELALGSFAILCTLTVFLLILLGLSKSYLIEIFSLQKMSRFIWLIPVGFFLVGLYQILYYWSLREKEFSSLTKAGLLQTLLSTSIYILLSKLGVFALLLGRIVGQSSSVFLLSRNFLKDLKEYKIKKKNVSSSLVEYKRFPLKALWSGFFNTLGQNITPLLLASFFGPTAAGYYALANRILAAPMTILGGAISNVLYSSAAEDHEKNKLSRRIIKIYKLLLTVGAPPLLSIFLFGPDLFQLILGNKWAVSGLYARLMTPWIYIVFITSPMTILFSVLNKEGFGALFQATLLISRILALYIGVMYSDVILAIGLFSLFSFLCWFSVLIWVFVNIEFPILKGLAYLFTAPAWSFVIFLPIYGSIYFIDQGAVGVVAGSVLSFILLCLYYIFRVRRVVYA